jgi:hypothetical protein
VPPRWHSNKVSLRGRRPIFEGYRTREQEAVQQARYLTTVYSLRKSPTANQVKAAGG